MNDSWARRMSLVNQPVTSDGAASSTAPGAGSKRTGLEWASATTASDKEPNAAKAASNIKSFALCKVNLPETNRTESGSEPGLGEA
jgi:hypothetical protein